MQEKNNRHKRLVQWSVLISTTLAIVIYALEAVIDVGELVIALVTVEIWISLGTTQFIGSFVFCKDIMLCT